MEENLRNSESYLQPAIYTLDRQNVVNHCPVLGNSEVTSDIYTNGDSHAGVPAGTSCPKDRRRTSLDCETFNHEVGLGNGTTSPMQENSSSIEAVSSDDSSDDTDQLTCYWGSDGSTSDDDRGGDFTVSKYMETKLSRLDEAKFGVWRVERAKVADCGVGAREVAGSSKGLPPIKLTLKKSLQRDEPEEVRPTVEKKTKHGKPSAHTKHQSASDPEGAEKRRGPGRPRSKNPSSSSTRKRLMNMFKKKYFKTRKRWARSTSCATMPPTIRSIAKP